MMKPMLPVALAVLAALAPAWVCAQAPGPTSTATLDPVIVTGSGAGTRAFDAPYSIDVIDADTLRGAGPGVNLSEALSRVPGLTVNNRSNYAQDLQISSRGFGARATFGVRGLRLYTDGIPASMPDGSGVVTHFDLAGAERIEILRGPFSALYGNSSGSLIALFSAPARTREVEFGVDAGRYGMRQLRASVAAPLANGWDLRMAASDFEIDGFRPHSEAQRRLGSLRLGYTGKSDTVTLLVNAINQPADDPLGLTREQFDQDPLQTAAPALAFNTRKTARQEQAGLNWRHRFDTAGALRETAVTVYGGQRAVTQWQSIPLDPQQAPRHPGGVIDLDRDYRGLDARSVWQLGPVRGVLGVNFEEQKEGRKGYENFVPGTPDPNLGVTGALRRDEANTARTREAYAQAEWKIAPLLAANLGVRTGRLSYRTRDAYVTPANPDDSGSLGYHYTNPAAGLSFTPSADLNLYISAGRGFEAPTLNELAYSLGGAAGFNAGLQPMQSRQLEVGAKWRSPERGLRLDAALFRADTRNEIGVLSNSGGRSTFQNVGRTRRQGVELAGSWQLAADWRVGLAATWLDATYRDGFLTCTATPCFAADVPVAAGKRIAGTTSKSAFAELVWQPADTTEIGVELRGQGDTPVNDLNTDAASGFGTVSLRALQRYKLPAEGMTLELLVRLDNATDRRYAGSVIVNEGNGRYFETAAPRSALIGLRLRSRF